MVGPRVCSAGRGKLNRHGLPAAMVQFKINTVDNGSLPEPCPRGATGVISDLSLLQHSTLKCHWGKKGPSEEDEKALTQFSLNEAAGGSCASCRGRDCSSPCQGLSSTKVEALQTVVQHCTNSCVRSS